MGKGTINVRHGRGRGRYRAARLRRRRSHGGDGDGLAVWGEKDETGNGYRKPTGCVRSAAPILSGLQGRLIPTPRKKEGEGKENLDRLRKSGRLAENECFGRGSQPGKGVNLGGFDEDITLGEAGGAGGNGNNQGLKLHGGYGPP